MNSDNNTNHYFEEKSETNIKTKQTEYISLSPIRLLRVYKSLLLINHDIIKQFYFTQEAVIQPLGLRGATAL